MTVSLLDPLVWLLVGLGLIAAELLLPGFVLVGLGTAAIAVSVVLLVLGDLITGIPLADGAILVVFAAFSLGSWWMYRKLFGVREGQSKNFDDEPHINDG